MISKTNCRLLANEETMFNENIYEPAEFAGCYDPRTIRALRDKIINLRYVNNLNFGRVNNIGRVPKKMASCKI